MSTNTNKLGLWVLTALVVGNMVGSGIFMLPSQLAAVASPGGALLAWILTGAGVLFTALVFGNLAVRKPELNGGPHMYAQALFAKGTHRSALTGFFVAWGYWVANWAGNVAIITTFASYLSTFFPILSNGAEVATIFGETITVGSLTTFFVCSALLWAMHTIVLRGVSGAGKVNFVATAAKVLGFALFIIAALFVFQSSHLVPFVADKATEEGTLDLLGQVNAAAVTTLWAFVGIESAVVFSSRARRQSDVKKSTMLGLLLGVLIYILISLLVMGVLSQEQLIASEKPLVDALSVIVGESGAYLMAGLGLVSLLGSALGWVMLSSEVPYQAAKQGLFPAVFLKENKHGAPVGALVITNIMSQLFIFSTISQSVSGAFKFVITVATLAYLVPYLVASIYQLKLTLTGENYLGQQARGRWTDLLIAGLATAYSIWVVKAGTADMLTFLLGIGMLLSGLLFFPFVVKSPLYAGRKK